MRVTIISKAFVVGEYQRKLEALAAQPDIELSAVVPFSWREAGRVMPFEAIHTRGYRLITAPLMCNGSFHMHFYPTLNRILRLTRPDVCHIDEEPYNLATWLAIQTARRYGARPLFFTWQNLLRKYPWPFSAMEQSAYRSCRAAIVGNADASRVLRAKGYRGELALIPQFGVDTDRFHPLNESVSRPFTIGYAGRLVESKGLLVLLRALALLPGEWRLRLSGAGPLETQMNDFIHAHDMTERVEFLRYTPSDQMPAFYQSLDALVLPSLSKPNWKEQFGRVLIEAMSCGIPVAGSDSGEIPNVLGDAGIITPEGDSRALADALARLRDDVPLRKQLGAVGRERVLAHYTHERIARETAEVYRWLVTDLVEKPEWAIRGSVV